MKKQMTEEERRRYKRKSLAFAIMMAFLIVFFMGGSFIAGYFLGVKVTVKYFTETMLVMFRSSDIKITANLSINETKLVDYMFEKLDGNKTLGSIQKKEYIPPCNSDSNIPKGETSRCIEQQPVLKNESTWWKP